MTDIYRRPGKILSNFGRFYPDAWKQVDEFRAKRKELRDWPGWCFLPLSGNRCHRVQGEEPSGTERKISPTPGL